MKTLQEIKNVEIDESLTSSAPPMILVLKRKAIRLFPSGESVALYHSDKLGIDISIPYNKNGTNNVGVSVKESVHGDIFGDYTHALKLHLQSGSKHTDHPELLKIKQKIASKYGKSALEHLHAASEHYLNGNVSQATHHYNKFQNILDEEYSEVILDDEYLQQEAVIHKIHHIAKTKQGSDVVFKNGAKARVEHPQAMQIMKLHTVLTPENKQKIENLINSGPEGLAKVAEFTSTNLK